MHVDMGIAQVVCGKDSKHYDEEMCDKAGKDLLHHTAGYIKTLRRLDSRSPTQRYRGSR